MMFSHKRAINFVTVVYEYTLCCVYAEIVFTIKRLIRYIETITRKILAVHICKEVKSRYLNLFYNCGKKLFRNMSIILRNIPRTKLANVSYLPIFKRFPFSPRAGTNRRV